MKKLIKNRKGFSLIEVILSVTLLAVVMVPLMTMFSSTVIVSNKIKDKIELDSVTRTIFENVSHAVKNGDELPQRSAYNPATNSFDPAIPKIKIKENIIAASAVSGYPEIVSPKLFVSKDPLNSYLDYSFEIKYKHDESDTNYYYDPVYPLTYNFILTIYKNGDIVNTLKIAVSANEQLH